MIFILSTCIINYSVHVYILNQLIKMKKTKKHQSKRKVKRKVKRGRGLVETGMLYGAKQGIKSVWNNHKGKIVAGAVLAGSLPLLYYTGSSAPVGAVTRQATASVARNTGSHIRHATDPNTIYLLTGRR